MRKTRDYDVGKKDVGRTRHIAVDTDDRFLMINLTSTNISDSATTPMILDTIRKHWPWVKHLFADGPTIGSSSWTGRLISTSFL